MMLPPAPEDELLLETDVGALVAKTVDDEVISKFPHCYILSI
jgi:hypothetical protein